MRAEIFGEKYNQRYGGVCMYVYVWSSVQEVFVFSRRQKEGE